MRFVLILILMLWGLPSFAAQIEKIVGGIEEGWSLGFLPDGEFLVTLRDGELRYFDKNGQSYQISGLPPIHAKGQGGLLDVLVLRDFATSQEILLSYSKPGNGTAIAKAKLDLKQKQFTNLSEIFTMQAHPQSDVHFGGRLIEAPDGTIFLTIGDRGDRQSAQNPNTHNGTLIRIHRDGSIPNDNPGYDLPHIYSIGHRNPQGIAFDPSGKLFVNEHGPQGGDEINKIIAGKNYGWPVIGFGRHYNGQKIGVGTSKPGMMQPEFYWDPSIAPSGMVIHNGQGVSQWGGLFFVGSLKFDQIHILQREQGNLREVQIIKSPQTNRVRDLRQAPDGSIWFISVGNDAIYRLTP